MTAVCDRSGRPATEDTDPALCPCGAAIEITDGFVAPHREGIDASLSDYPGCC